MIFFLIIIIIAVSCPGMTLPYNLVWDPVNDASVISQAVVIAVRRLL